MNSCIQLILNYNLLNLNYMQWTYLNVFCPLNILFSYLLLNISWNWIQYFRVVYCEYKGLTTLPTINTFLIPYTCTCCADLGFNTSFSINPLCCYSNLWHWILHGVSCNANKIKEQQQKHFIATCFFRNLSMEYFRILFMIDKSKQY